MQEATTSSAILDAKNGNKVLPKREGAIGKRQIDKHERENANDYSVSQDTDSTENRLCEGADN